jgi:dihydrolipoamide dehydrogenase
MEVTLIDPEPDPGGVCLYRGCIPSKALLHVARVVHESEAAARWGIHYAPPRVELDRVRAWKNEVVGKLTGGLGQLARARKVRYLQGRGRFTDPRTLRVEREGGGAESLGFDHVLVATGSEPVRLPGLPWDSGLVMDSTGGLDLAQVPERLLVVGGGYIGLELGTVYAALGSRVTVVEMLEGLLPGVDTDLVRPLSRRMEEICEAVRVKTRVASMKVAGGKLRVTFEGEGASGGEEVFDRALVSVGRRPLSRDLGLESTRVEVDERGFLQVDAQLRTREPGVSAIGDVVGQPMLAHKASHEGRTAVEAIAGKGVAFEPRAIPAVVFTDPEIAWCGLTEVEARAEGRKVEVARFPWAASGRALTLDRTDGLTKLLVDPESRRVVGVGIAGPGAGELIAEGVLAVEMAATVEDMALSIHPHPTLSETFMEAAEVFLGTSTHLHRPRRPER